MKHIGTTVFGTVTAVMLSFANLIHLPFTFWLVSEQIKTGFGFGTKVEMGALLIWIAEIVAAPALIAGGIFLILHIRRRATRPIGVLNIILFFLALAQYALTNLFLFI